MLGETVVLVHNGGVNSVNAARKETYNRVHGNAVSLQEKVDIIHPCKKLATKNDYWHFVIVAIDVHCFVLTDLPLINTG